MADSANKPLALVSNDDGIRFHFLHILAEALAPHFEVVIAAPSAESSWIGRAVSRRKRLNARKFDDCGFTAWEIDGTPTDAVNIALAHLLEGRRPDVVLSGINLGYNTTAPLILSSGTVAAALEGACWGIHAIAASMQLPRERYVEVRDSDGHIEGDDLTRLQRAAQHATAFALELLNGSAPQPMVVHNLNFPWSIDERTERVDTIPSPWHVGSLYQRDQEGLYSFAPDFANHPSDIPDNWDRQAIYQGKISHSVIDFGKMGR